jgi:hypothetical protein
MNTKLRFKSLIMMIVIVLLAPISIVTAGKNCVIVAGNFSSAKPGASLPEGWKHMTFKSVVKHTNYSLVTDHDTTVILAKADS